MECGIMSEFEEFWINYPREGQLLGSKKKAREKYESLSPDLYHMILMAILSQKAWRMKAKLVPSIYVPAPKYVITWLNQECWDDELPEIKTEVSVSSLIENANDRSWAN